jgi:hypothetical protein
MAGWAHCAIPVGNTKDTPPHTLASRHTLSSGHWPAISIHSQVR